MTRAAEIPAIAWAVLAFAAWQSSELLNAWRNSALDHLGWVAFLVWLTPAFAQLGPLRTIHPCPPALTSTLIAASLAAALVGILADFNTASYVSLAFAVAALGGWSRFHPLWLASAIAWMPAFSWAGQFLPRPALISTRIAATTLAALPVLVLLAPRRPPQTQS